MVDQYRGVETLKEQVETEKGIRASCDLGKIWCCSSYRLKTVIILSWVIRISIWLQMWAAFSSFGFCAGYCVSAIL